MYGFRYWRKLVQLETSSCRSWKVFFPFCNKNADSMDSMLLKQLGKYLIWICCWNRLKLLVGEENEKLIKNKRTACMVLLEFDFNNISIFLIGTWSYYISNMIQFLNMSLLNVPFKIHEFFSRFTLKFFFEVSQIKLPYKCQKCALISNTTTKCNKQLVPGEETVIYSLDNFRKKVI